MSTTRLIESAVARGVAAAATHPPDGLLDMAAAAQHVYRRPDRREAFRELRRRYPEIDACSVGTGRFRRFRVGDLDRFLATKPAFGRRAVNGGPPM